MFSGRRLEAVKQQAKEERELGAARLKLQDRTVDTGLEGLFETAFRIRDEPPDAAQGPGGVAGEAQHGGEASTAGALLSWVLPVGCIFMAVGIMVWNGKIVGRGQNVLV